MNQKRETERQQRHFQAGIQGIDLSKHEKDNVDERVEAAKRRAAARLAGGEEELEASELTAIGFKVKKA